MQAKSDRKKNGAESRWQENRRHWEQTLDARNVASDARPASLKTEAKLFDTADVRWAFDRLEPLAGTVAVDLGGGLGLGAILLAKRGARVVICDVSLPRLREAKKNIEALGLGARVRYVLGSGERLPFRSGSLGALFTKSVLIHTRLEETARECGRVLAPQGRGAFIEPMRKNPFVNLYRALAAPKVWKSITTYFRAAEFRILAEGLRASGGGKIHFRGFFLLGFLASVFHFAISSPSLYRMAECAGQTADEALFRLFPKWRRRCWFGVLVFEKDGS